MQRDNTNKNLEHEKLSLKLHTETENQKLS